MKPLFLVANWKSNKTIAEARDWLKTLKENFGNISQKKQVVVCPSYTILSDLKQLISEYGLPFKIGAQDISPFSEGEYTGAINGQQIKDLADFVIVGHSERRKHFGENLQVLNEKTLRAKENNLETFYCISEKEEDVPQEASFVVYEPLFAIGSGNPDTFESADHVARFIKDKSKLRCVLYGGSVNSQNVNSFTSMSNIDGVFVGKASLDPLEFAKIIELA